jgi:hypothetical protein
MRVNSKNRIPEVVHEAVKKRLVGRLPLTFRPFINQQLNAWETLFPFEENYLVLQISYLMKLDSGEFDALFNPLRGVETRMQVDRWPFSTREPTLENATLLARSPYYQEWRREVQRVFSEIEEHFLVAEGQTGTLSRKRLVLIILPACLPFDPKTVWKSWGTAGRELTLDLEVLRSGRTFCDTLFHGAEEPSAAPGFLEALLQRPEHSASDLWIVDAGSDLTGSLSDVTCLGRASPAAIFLSFAQLKTFRNAFLEELNAIRKDLSDADAVYARLRQVDVTPWCPPMLVNQPLASEFVRALFLSGNGSLVFSNAFVEWAASEAFRRARPATLIACFGTRNKPKPFTSVAVFENQEAASPLPEVEDLAGSAVDAEILARYVWLAASRYSEYGRALCLCLAENLPVAYAIGPPEDPLLQEPQPIKLEKISSLLSTWLA